MQTLIVVDYGMGNLRSVAKAFEFVAREGAIPTRVAISASPQAVREADRVVFPGQGAMPDCMRYLTHSGLESAVREAAASKPFFGVCVGMQMLFEHAEEGDTPGLGLFAGTVPRFRPRDHALKVPHMGWNEVRRTREHALWQDIPDAERFYYVHSYFCLPDEDRVTAATTDYGGEFAAAIARENVFATQFHPEKSHRAGLTLYRNFLTWKP
ncbi:MAG TPA: imidazole glycerol phosphate synthase subunit HisH [Usitatibacteraceae bacterium]|nr:imidazole glycerol phosphate synthase subunit HisH [Usitatibacteraceae bacterium]